MTEHARIQQLRQTCDGIRRIIYEVTEQGVDLVPVMVKIGAWAARAN